MHASRLFCPLALVFTLFTCMNCSDQPNDITVSGSSYGQKCVEGADCAENLCVNLGSFSVCSRDCGSVACPDGDKCIKAGSRYVCLPLAAYGQECANNSDCLSGLCAFTGNGGLCTQLCDKSSCPNGNPCVSAGSSKVCKPVKATVADGGMARDTSPAPDAQKCVPNCKGKNCGPDGCGGTCGACASPSVCCTFGNDAMCIQAPKSCECKCKCSGCSFTSTCTSKTPGGCSSCSDSCKTGCSIAGCGWMTSASGNCPGTPKCSSWGASYSNSGAKCVDNDDCAAGDACVQLNSIPGAPSMCLKRCTVPGSLCPVRDSTKQQSKCGISLTSGTYVCAWMCEVSGKNYTCPLGSGYGCYPHSGGGKICAPL